MRTVLILRHAKSSWKNANLSDHDRPLNRRGERDAPRMGRLLREEMLTPDLIISSDAKRALRTAELVALNSGYEREIEVSRGLYLGDPQDYVEHLSKVDDLWQRVMVVGHNPGLEMLLEQLTGEEERLPTAALARVELPLDSWRQLDGETEGKLTALWLPRELS